MNDTRCGRKGQQIQVFVRIRPFNSSEQNLQSTTVLDIPNNKEIIVHERPNDKVCKKFRFNNVFGPLSKQIDVYNNVVSPLLEQVLAGYNCTVFAYGQTGTGKTYTMEGINIDPTLHWNSNSSAGMIPRSLNHLFHKLQLLEIQEYTIRVSFLELYNEDLFDLLSTNSDASKLRLYEDVSKKGAVIIHGLEEVTIHNTSEVYKILKKGADKRQTAATLMNAQSSRSHTIFSITIHMKESTIDGEEILKTGKLNLVDLAGSENVGRSGSVDKRAREAGSINQSLLTLGRVITALVERAPHIPYRESKLTRLLQESLGGRTKTSIIATISPASINLEETLSTLDYAHRAKNITNRPEINQKLSKREFLKQYTEEIEKLRRDLLASRDRNGVYLADDNYKEMQKLISQQTKQIEEKINHIKALEKAMQDKEKIFYELELQNIAQTKELNEVKIKLNNTTDALQSTNYRLKLTMQERDEHKYLVEKHMNTEQSLLNQGHSLLNVADTAITDSYKLHDKIDRKSKTEQKFEVLGNTLRSNICEYVQNVEKDVSTYGEKLKELFTSIKNDLEISIKSNIADTATHRNATSNPNQSDITNLTTSINESHTKYQNWIQNEIRNMVGTVECEDELISVIHQRLIQSINNKIENVITKNLQVMRNNVCEKLTEASTRLEEMIDASCNYELKINDRTIENVRSIMKDIEVLRNKQKFSEKQHLFAKTMQNVFSQFNELRKIQEEHYSTVTDKCNYVNTVCNEVNTQVISSSNTNVKMRNDLKDYIQSDLKKIENNVIVGTKQNEEIANRITNQGKDLINELKSNVNENCNASTQYKNTVEYISKNHAKFVEDKKVEIENTCQNISTQLKNQTMESCMRNDNVIGQLETAVGEINKFFDEDVQRDIPTGLTPARKNFAYPRQFKTTSPHERILQKFRETGKLLNVTEDEDTQENISMISEMTMKQIANSTALSDITLVSSAIENTAFDTCLSKSNEQSSFTDSDIVNTTQTLDVSKSMQFHIQSESAIYRNNENKENDNNVFTQQLEEQKSK
ncbi:hypothetical protein WN51_11438 [Melipona quadrifasciata]|uniref:Kinesin motor domain-containing protein n=1 Tax=Melipona quadrifasciata TaxID=166423 RepID=A0A0M9A999_9HYME|nr:hypothetical protein WN51_11438 [Melipona quadrifasciata]